MLANQATGQGAASKKYDMLTALGAMACANDGLSEKTALRFMLLITARYNWARDELSIGRVDIARLWQVDERTVKRELAKLKSNHWLTVKRPAARGRVTVYAICWDRVLASSRSVWTHVGLDFEARMSMMVTGKAPTAAENSKVVAFPIAEGEGPWGRIRKLLHEEDAAFFSSWFARLDVLEMSETRLKLNAPTSFHAQYITTHGMDRLIRAAMRIVPGLKVLEVSADRPTVRDRTR